MAVAKLTDEAERRPEPLRDGEVTVPAASSTLNRDEDLAAGTNALDPRDAVIAFRWILEYRGLLPSQIDRMVRDPKLAPPAAGAG